MPANPSTPEVTQGDRNFAADYLRNRGKINDRDHERICQGLWDHTDDVLDVARHRLAHSPVRGGDELREATFAGYRLQGPDGEDYFNDTATPLSDNDRRNGWVETPLYALASTDMASADHLASAGKPMAGAGEVEALTKARDALEHAIERMVTLSPARANVSSAQDMHIAIRAIGLSALEASPGYNDRPGLINTDPDAAPQVERLTSGEGEPVGAMLICDQTGGRIFTWWPVPQHQKQEADSIYGSHGGYRTVPLYAASPKAIATASVREDETIERCAQVCDELFSGCTHSDTEAFAYEAAAKAIRDLSGAV